jgi:hypothetical protein
MCSKGIENQSNGEKENKTIQPDVKVYWTVILKRAGQRLPMPWVRQFQIKLQIGNAGDGALDWFVQMTNRCSGYWREKADLGGQ